MVSEFLASAKDQIKKVDVTTPIYIAPFHGEPPFFGLPQQLTYLLDRMVGTQDIRFFDAPHRYFAVFKLPFMFFYIGSDGWSEQPDPNAEFVGTLTPAKIRRIPDLLHHYILRLAEQFKVVGGNPQKLAFAEVYQALQTGVVDGTENPWSNIYTKKFHEVQKYIMDSNHGLLDYMVIANAAWWNKLPADVKTALSKAMLESIRHGNKIAFDEDMAYRQKVIDDKRAQVLPMSKPELTQWREAMKPVWKKFEADIGADIINAALAANK